MPTLRQIREENYISRSELSRLSGVSASTIVRIEDGTTHTTREVAEKLVNALSERIGVPLSLDSIEGINLYNIMRDRKQRTKKSEDAA